VTQHAGYGVFDRDSLLPKRPKLRSNDAMSYSLPRLLAPISILFALLGCTVSPGRVEESIKDEFKKDDIELESIKCPADIKQKDGATFECTGTSDLGDEFTVEVKLTDDKGSLKWELVGKVFKYDALEERVKELGASADVKCGKGKGKFVAVKGTKVKCRAGAEELVVKFTNNDAKFELVEGKRPAPPPT